jgi:hypothetical protein
LKDVGIAGMHNFEAVKCLHCHYAHFLARPEHRNIIGKWVHELLFESDLQATLDYTADLSSTFTDVCTSIEDGMNDHGES